MATQRFTRNSISSIKADDGRLVSDHLEMAGLLWASYKDRMGCSNGIDMKFDLSTIVDRVEDLEEISLPFSQE